MATIRTLQLNLQIILTYESLYFGTPQTLDSYITNVAQGEEGAGEGVDGMFSLGLNHEP